MQITLRWQPRERRQRLLRRIRQYRSIYLMFLPVLLYFAVFSFYPLLLGFVQSLQKERMLGTPTFIGLGNYRTLFQDYVFWRAFQNSVVLGTSSLLINILAGLLISLAVNEVRARWLRSSVQTVTFLPFLFSWTVVGSLWIYALAPTGLVNQTLARLGIPGIGFLTDARLGPAVILFTNEWKQAGYFVVLFMAAIVSLDPALFEAARMDGATRMQQIAYVLVPGLGMTIKTLLVVGATGVLRNFDQVFIMSRPAIKDSIRSLLLYIYEEGILQFRIGKATSAATVVLLTTLLISTLVRRLARYDRGVEG
ncbi:MAG: ABC transporter permease subunit [Christensenellales bacterium]